MRLLKILNLGYPRFFNIMQPVLKDQAKEIDKKSVTCKHG